MLFKYTTIALFQKLSKLINSSSELYTFLYVGKNKTCKMQIINIFTNISYHALADNNKDKSNNAYNEIKISQNEGQL